GTEPEHGARNVQQLERVDQQPPLPLQRPRQQANIVRVIIRPLRRFQLLEPVTHPIPELNDLEPQRRLRRQLTQRRSEQPRRLLTAELLTPYASRDARTSRRCSVAYLRPLRQHRYLRPPASTSMTATHEPAEHSAYRPNHSAHATTSHEHS